MGLSYHFKFTAPAERTATELEIFLKSVEASAKAMGFDPTMVLDACIDTDERRTFAKRLTRGLIIEDTKLEGVALLAKEQVWNHDPVEGYCRVIPKRGVVLIVTDEKQRESIFGFFQYPSAIVDLNQRVILETPVGSRWTFENFLDSPDQRYRQIVNLFAEAGFVEAVKDEFDTSSLPRW